MWCVKFRLCVISLFGVHMTKEQKKQKNWQTQTNKRFTFFRSSLKKKNNKNKNKIIYKNPYRVFVFVLPFIRCIMRDLVLAVSLFVWPPFSMYFFFFFSFLYIHIYRYLYVICLFAIDSVQYGSLLFSLETWASTKQKSIWKTLTLRVVLVWVNDWMIASKVNTYIYIYWYAAVCVRVIISVSSL